MSEIIFKEDAIVAMLAMTAYPDEEEMKNGVSESKAWTEWIGGVLDSINAVKDIQPAFSFGDERLKPKKPYVHVLDTPTWSKNKDKVIQCPNCKRRMRYRSVSNLEAYCPKCGQAIDWSEEK